MALDISKLKKAQADVQARMARGGGGPSMKFWRPKDGENRVRVLPPWTDTGVHAGTFWREVWQHWKVSEEESGPLLCPKKTPGADNTDCPICDYVDSLRAKKNDVNAQEAAKDLRAKVAYLMSIIDLADPVYTAKDTADWKKDRPDTDCPFVVGGPKVQVYAATSTIYEGIASMVLSNDMDITDMESGHNVIINKIGNKDPMKTRYGVQPELKKTKAQLPVGFELPDLGQIGRFKNYEDMVKLLASGAGAGAFATLPSAVTAEKTVVATSWVEGDNSGEDLAAEMLKSLGE